MSNFGILCKTELKKILCKKAIWIALFTGLAFIGFVELARFIMNEHYTYGNLEVPIKEIEYRDIENSKEINGKPMDETFYERFRNQMNEEWEKQKGNPDILKDVSSLDTGYPGFWPIVELSGNDWFVQKELRWLGGGTEENKTAILMTGSVSEIEATKRNKLEININYDCPSEAESSYWMERFDSIPKPYIYSYAQGYQQFFSSCFILVWLSFLIILIGLTGSFADENTYKTDALILSSKYGRKSICRVKLLVGLCFSAVVTILIMTAGLVFPMIGYGLDGWNTPVQNAIIGCAYNMTIGQAVILSFVFGILVSVLWASTVMLFSLILRNTVPVMAIHAAALLISVFDLPSGLGTLSKIWALKPCYFVFQGMFKEYRLFNIAGSLVNHLQMGATVFILLTLISVMSTFFIYRDMQVASR